MSLKHSQMLTTLTISKELAPKRKLLLSLSVDMGPVILSASLNYLDSCIKAYLSYIVKTEPIFYTNNEISQYLTPSL